MSDKPRYVAHYGGKQPVADDVMVEVVFSDGKRCIEDYGPKAGDFERGCWEHDDWCIPIIAYRILEDE